MEKKAKSKAKPKSIPSAPLGKKFQYWATEARRMVTNLQSSTAFMYGSALRAEDLSCENPIYYKGTNREKEARKKVAIVRKELPFLKSQLAQLEKSLEKLAEEGY